MNVEAVTPFVVNVTGQPLKFIYISEGSNATDSSNPNTIIATSPGKIFYVINNSSHNQIIRVNASSLNLTIHPNSKLSLKVFFSGSWDVNYCGPREWYLSTLSTVPYIAYEPSISSQGSISYSNFGARYKNPRDPNNNKLMSFQATQYFT